VALLEEEARKVRQGKARLRMAPAALYAGLPAAAQLAAFEPAPRGYRKVLVHVGRNGFADTLLWLCASEPPA